MISGNESVRQISLKNPENPVCPVLKQFLAFFYTPS